LHSEQGYRWQPSSAGVQARVLRPESLLLLTRQQETLRPTCRALGAAWTLPLSSSWPYLLLVQQQLLLLSHCLLAPDAHPSCH
jgi:hypothetical protein